MEFKDYDTSSIVLVRTIGEIRTHFDLMDSIATNQKESNSFWDLICENLYDLIILDTFKLIDKKNLSLFFLIKELKGLNLIKLKN